MDVNDLEFHGIQFEAVCGLIKRMREIKYFSTKISIIPTDVTDVNTNYKSLLLSFTNYDNNVIVSIDHFGKTETITNNSGV
jgi:hypothetical protein